MTEKLYLDTSDLLGRQKVDRTLLGLVNATAEKPNSLPWLAVALYPLKKTKTPPDISWLPQFESDLACTILSQQRDKTRSISHKMSKQECEALFASALEAGNAGKHEQAESFLRQLMLQKPKNYEYARNLGRALCDLGKYGQAIEVLKKAEQLNPEDRLTQFEMGKLHLMTENCAEAEKQFRKVLLMPARKAEPPY